MNQEDLLNVIGEATEEMLERSEKKTVPVKRIVFAAVAACLALVITILLVAPQQNDPEKDAKIINDVFGCKASTRFTSKEEYDAFMAGDGAKLPNSFVSWDEASALGEVHRLLLLGEDRYSYVFSDDSDCIIYMDVDPSPELTTRPIVPLSAVTMSSSGYREIAYDGYNGDVDYILQRNGVDYSYDRGSNKLHYIQYYIDGVQIHITIDGGLSNYPNRTDTLVGKLLSADDSVANAAFAEIQEKLSK